MTDQPAVPFNPRRADDPFHRLQVQAENRARRLGATEDEAAKAGRKAMILRRALLDLKIEPNAEHILAAVAGELRSGKEKARRLVRALVIPTAEG